MYIQKMLVNNTIRPPQNNKTLKDEKEIVSYAESKRL